MKNELFEELYKRSPRVDTSSEKIIKALEMALEMTTPENAGVPWEHEDHKTNIGNRTRDLPEWL